MTMRSTQERYGSVAIALHWGSAGAILALVPMGFAMQATEGAARVGLYRAHVAIGLLALALTLARVAWRVFGERERPATLPAPEWQRRAARIVHGALIVALLALGVSGIGMMVLSGAGAPLFGEGLAPLPGAFDAYPPRALHGRVAIVLLALLALHVAGALMHHLVVRDATLTRMLPARGAQTLRPT
ncbi:cytochrome b [Salinarimonas sp.]|uniref:cytochrome b n=1 Tax=Salinarimonas sp. TaxID=2766526 RepID=UPI00391A0BFF